MRLILLTIIACLAPALANACGRTTDCAIAGGSYRIAMPEGWDGSGKVPAILFFHGWQATSEGMMRDNSLISQAGRAGIALIVPQGLGRSWSYPGSPMQNRDEFAFIAALRGDFLNRFAIDPERIMVSGFSIGGAMAWFTACYMGDQFAGYAPISGAYWDPIPKTCPSPPPIILHTHGTTDNVVPLAGRAIANSRQSDVFRSFAQWSDQTTCPPLERHDPPADGLACYSEECGGGVLEICLHSGGHSLRTEYVMRAWNRLSALKGWD